MFVYIKSEPGLWTVGHYSGGEKWMAESDHTSESEAADRAAYLNGGNVGPDPSDLQLIGEWLCGQVSLVDSYSGVSKNAFENIAREAVKRFRLAGIK